MVLLVICGSHVVVNAPSTSLWSESGVHACHTAQLQSTVCVCGVVTVISVAVGGVQLTRVSGAVSGGRVCSLRFVWVEPGPWPAPVVAV